MRAVTLIVLLGLGLTARPAEAGLTWMQSVELWWARGSLDSSKWWRDHFAAAEHGLELLIEDVNAAIDGDVEYVHGRVADGGWYVKKRTAVAGILRKMERGEYSTYVAKDVHRGHLESSFKQVRWEPFSPTAAGRVRAVTAAVQLREAAVGDLQRELDRVRRSHVSYRRDVRELEAKVRRLEALENGTPVVSSAPVNHTPAPIQLLGVR